MADYNVMLGLELESDAIQKIENRIKNIKESDDLRGEVLMTK